MTSRVLFKAERLFAAGAGAGPVMGLDSAGPVAALAIVAGGRVISEIAHSAASHGAELPAAVEELLHRAGTNLRDIRGIAAGIGPGSFTGLRVGLSYVKGLAMALGCSLVGVPTFDSLALKAQEYLPPLPPKGTLCVVMDARRGEVYAGLYRIVSDGLEKVSEPSVISLPRLVLQLPAEAILAGDKAREVSDLLGSRGMRSTVLDEVELNLRGRYVAAIGAERLASGEADPPAALQPLYVRTAEATFKPGAAYHDAAMKERPWSAEKKSSSGNI